MGNESNQIKAEPTPPVMSAAVDGSGDAELLKAISRNPETAHALAAIASGAAPEEVLSSLLPRATAVEQENEETEETQPENRPAKDVESIPVGSTVFLSSAAPDFWDF